ncbi:MAG TPA: transglutaminase family protein [Chitinophagales bacterium]|nr:transglutaminase family protein [Chitinophagales bacterium]
MEFNKSEYNALIHLLDDDDSEVVEHVFDKIEEVGEVGIPILENYLQSGNHLLQKRILKLLNKFEWFKVYNELQLWHDQEEKELLKAVFLISKVFDPKLEENTIVQQIERISQRIWLRVYQNQSAFEQIQVFNYVIFSERAFENQGNVYGAYQFSLVDKVLSSKKGNSLGIGLIYLLIAESLELPIYGIVLPNYFALTFTKYWHSQKSMENQDVINDIIF